MFFGRRSSVRLVALSLFCAVFAAFASVASGTDEEMKAIEKRAAEIAPMLADAPERGALALDRAFWDERAASASGKYVVKAAEALLERPMPELSEELYKEFYKNGNRDNYQNVYFKLVSRFSVLGMAEVLENKGRFIQPFEEALSYLCDQPSWVLPAHDTNAEIYDGKAIYSDLGSTSTSGQVAAVINLLRDKMTPELYARAVAEIERRVLAPYERDVKADKPQGRHWWIRGANNWNAVCHAGVVCSALNAIESKERRAFFIAAAEYFSERDFMRGFTDDGYCTEGMGYWNYGFGYYEYLGALIRVATKGEVDLFRFPKIHAILDYAPTQEIDKGNFVAFADCSLTVRPNALYVGYLSRLKGFGYTDYEARGLGDHIILYDPILATSIVYDREVSFPAEEPKAEDFSLPIRSDFPSAGVVICRPSADATGAYFAVAMKGGNNNELHNHNDVGSYSLVLGSNDADKQQKDVFINRDPGGENYTARTFSGRRYEGELLNSFGHPVPRINGTLQSVGAQAKGEVVEKTFSDELDVLALDMTSAYDVPTLASVQRRFEFKRASGSEPGYFEVSDTISFKEGEEGEIETALITFEKESIETTDSGVVVKISGAVVRASAVDAAGNALKLVVDKAIVGENDENALNKPTRLAFRVDGKANNATITLRYEVAK